MESRKHIFYIPSFRQGGLENVFTKYLASICTETSLVTLVTQRKSLPFVASKLSDSNVSVVYTPSSRIFRLPFVLVYVLKNRKHFFHAVQYDALRLFLVVGRVFSVNLLYHERTYLNKNFLENIRRGISRLNKAPLCITSNSDDQVRLFKNTLGPSQQFIRLHNPIINESLKQVRSYNLTHSKKRKVFCAGRFDGQKNLMFFVQNAKTISDILQVDKIHIFSEVVPPYCKDYLKWCEFHSFKDNIYEILKSFDTILINTQFEGFSNQLFESLFACLNVICSKHEHGFEELERLFEFNTFEPNSLEDLKKSLLRVKHVTKQVGFACEKELEFFYEEKSLIEFRELIKIVDAK